MKVKVGDLVRENFSGWLGIVVGAPKPHPELRGQLQAKVRLNRENFSRRITVKYLEVINASR